jgi:hypothetical protein
MPTGTKLTNPNKIDLFPNERTMRALSCVASLLLSACAVSASLVHMWDAHANFQSTLSHHTFVLSYDSTRQGHTAAAAAFEAAVEQSARQPQWQSSSVDAGVFDVAADANRGWLRGQIPAHAADIAGGEPVMFYFHRQRSSWHKYLTMTEDGIARFITKKLSRSAETKTSNAASVPSQLKQHSAELTLFVRMHSLSFLESQGLSAHLSATLFLLMHVRICFRLHAHSAAFINWRAPSSTTSPTHNAIRR